MSCLTDSRRLIIPFFVAWGYQLQDVTIQPAAHEKHNKHEQFEVTFVGWVWQHHTGKWRMKNKLPQPKSDWTDLKNSTWLFHHCSWASLKMTARIGQLASRRMLFIRENSIPHFTLQIRVYCLVENLTTYGKPNLGFYLPITHVRHCDN